MFNILDFIDSKDIREYNRDTQFTLIEQAYLIYHSLGTTIEEKMSAWRELLDTFDEESFQWTRFGKVQFYEDRSNRQILLDMLTVYENTLKIQHQNEGIVFDAYYTGSPTHVYFPDYQSAYEYLQSEKEDYDDDVETYTKVCGQWSHTAVVAQIKVWTYGKTDWYSNVFHFDENLRLVHLWPNRELFVSEFDSLRYLPIYIPSPFREGDSVRVISSPLHKYAVIQKLHDEAFYAAESKEPYPQGGHSAELVCIGNGHDYVAPEDYPADDDYEYTTLHYCNVLELEK